MTIDGAAKIVLRMLKALHQIFKGSEQLLVHCRPQNTFNQAALSGREFEKNPINTDGVCPGTGFKGMPFDGWPDNRGLQEITGCADFFDWHVQPSNTFVSPIAYCSRDGHTDLVSCYKNGSLREDQEYAHSR